MKLRATSYTFDASAKTIDCALFTSLEAVQLIVNVTDNLIIYNFADTSKGGTLASTILTLEYDTTSMSDTDDLMILVEDGTTSIAINDGGNTITVDGTVTANLSATDNAVLDNIDADLTTLIGHVDGVEALLTTVDADTSNISTKIDTIAGAVSGTEMQVDVVTSALPTGASTLAEQQSQTTHLATIAGDTTAIETAVQLIDDTVYTDGTGTVTKGIAILGQDGTNPQAIKTDASGELQVDVLTMPTVAVTNAGITTIAGAVSGTEMQVDVITMPTTTVTATNLDIRDLTASDIVTIADIKDGAGDSVMDATNNAVKVNVVAGGAGDGSILDGANSAIKATVLDYTNSNPLAVRLTDSNGDYVAAGAGTQYTEDDAAAANPVGGMLMSVRADSLAAVTTTDGDNIALRATNKGELYTKATDSDALLTTIDADTSNISTKIDTIAGAVAGTEVQVDIVSAPTLTVNAHAVTNAGTFAVQVDGAALTSLQLIDDAVYTDGSGTVTKGVAVLGQDGTNPQAIKTDANGELQVDVLTMPTVAVTQSGTWDEVGINDSGNSITVDNGGTFAVQVDGSALTSLQLLDDAVATTASAITTKGFAVSGTDGTNARVLKTDTSGELQIDVLSIAAGTNNIGDVDVLTVPSDPFGANADAAATAGSTGTMQAKFRLMTSQLDSIKTAVETLDNTVGGTELQVDVVGALPAGTNAIGKLAANSGVDIGDVDVTSVIAGTGATNLGKAEDAGHTTGDTGVAILGVRNNTPNTATTNADSDYSQLSTDMVGGLRTALYETDFAVLGTNHVKKYYTNAGAVTDGIVWSPAAGKRWYVTDLIVNVSAAATVTFEDDKAGGDEAVMKFELAANSGIAHRFQTPLFSGEDAADLLVTTSAGNIYCTVCGYEV